MVLAFLNNKKIRHSRLKHESNQHRCSNKFVYLYGRFKGVVLWNKLK